MRKQPLSLTADPEIRASFQEQLAEARATPGLRRFVRQPAPDLYPRYSDYYRQLCRLPRRVRRGLQRQWKRSLSTLALLLALGQVPALAATINVDGTNCTLAEAIGSANTNTAVGGCSKGSGADTLVLAPKSTHTLSTVEDTTYADTGLPLVTSTITVAGNHSTIERGAGAPKFRLMAVSSMGKLTLEELTLRGGYAPGSVVYSYDDRDDGGGGILNHGGSLTLIGCIVSGNTAYGSTCGTDSCIFGDGGGVSSFDGTLTLRNSTVSDNTAIYGRGGGVFNNQGALTLTNSTISGNTVIGYRGGGGLSDYGNASATLTNSTVSGNTATAGGGGVSNGGTLTLRNSTVSDNTATIYGGGGGVSNGGTLTIMTSTVSGNTGGGVYNTNGTLTVTNSTISGNKLDSYGGGVHNGSNGTLTLTNSTVSGNTGGGVSNTSGTLTVTNSTISGNTNTTYGFIDAGSGGGVFNNQGTLTLINSTIFGNRARDKGGGMFNSQFETSILTMRRSLITGNTASIGPEVFNDTYTPSGTVHANDFNLFGHNSNARVVGFSPGPTDVIPTVSLNRILAPLAANGGPTRTRALVRGSPAIDAVRARCPPPANDQRGLPRPVDGDGDLEERCDIGAFEFDPRGMCVSVRPSKGCRVNGVPDQLCGGTADDDTIVGTSRNDVILGRRGNDVLSGLAGHDLLCGGQHDDLIRGGAGQDTIEGNDGEDELFGGLRDDWIKGGKGNDFLDGGSGKDRLEGQQGTDTCVNGESVSGCP